MTERIPALDMLLDGLETAVRSAGLDAPTQIRVDEVFGALRAPAKPRPGHRPSRLPVCDLLDDALSAARRGNENIGRIAEAFSRVEPGLSWTRRAGSEAAGRAFHDGHANAILIGPGGVEERTGIWLGVSLMSPRVQYPLHSHPPEEIYVVLSPGDWKKADSAWEAPGVGGVVHNPSATVHSMRSLDSPLLAFWLLWSHERAAD